MHMRFIFISSSLVGILVLNASAATYYVSITSGNDTNSGLSWAESMASPTTALALVTAGDSVIVSNGTYASTTLTVPLGVSLFGTSHDGTVIESTNSPAIALYGSISNLTVSSFGGIGVRCFGTSGVVNRVTVRDCANHGIYVRDASARIDRTVARGNGGSGFLVEQQSAGVRLENCMAWSNQAYGIFFNNGRLSLNFVTLEAEARNCTVYGNVQGGIRSLCDRWYNGSFFVRNTSNVDVYNTISWGNQGASVIRGGSIYADSEFHTFNLSHSCLQGGYPGSAILTNNPAFVDAANGDVGLTFSSPCINAGSNEQVNASVDLAGNARVQYLTVDMGAYEYEGPPIPQAALPGTRYVAITSTNPVYPYTNWLTAATNIQDAVDAALAGDRVLVSNGVYDTGGRLMNYNSNPSLTNRVIIDKAITVESVNGPSATSIVGSGPPGENAVRCVWLASNATLVGFTVTNGYTYPFPSNDGPAYAGGGVFVEGSYFNDRGASAIISNCVVVGCYGGTDGGGIHGGTIYDSTVKNNYSFYEGGGVRNSTVFNSVIADNTCNGSGGGVSQGRLINCEVASNSAVYGGGAWNSTLSNCTVVANVGAGAYSCEIYDSLISQTTQGPGIEQSTAFNCEIVGNKNRPGFVIAPEGEGFGGALYSTLINCFIADNEGYYTGGASGSTLINCILVNNHCLSDGGASHSSTLNNCLLIGNSADRLGGAAVDSTLNNCTVFNNSAAIDGGGLALCEANNSIVFGNTPNDLATNELYNVTTSYCYTNDPFFVDATNGDYRLSLASPCIDAGMPIAGVTNDLAGVPRPLPRTFGQQPRFDIGAYEFAPKGRYVWSGGNNNPPYDSWSNAANNIQDVLDIAVAGEYVAVEQGVYTSSAPLLVTGEVVLVSVSGPSNTIIDASQSGRGVELRSGGTLWGFTVRNGFTTDCGGVQAVEGSTVRNCIIVDNEASVNGGGLCLFTGSQAIDCLVVSNIAQNGAGVYAYSGTVHHCEVSYNTHTAGIGGGVFMANGSMLTESQVTGNTNQTAGGIYMEDSVVAWSAIRGNQALQDGGGAVLSGGLLHNSWIENNLAGQDGGGVRLDAGEMRTSLITENTAVRFGGGLYLSTSGSVVNATVADNVADTLGSGVYLNGPGSLWNSIVYWNTSDNLYTNAPGADIRYSCVTPLVSGEGNIASDPLFVDTNDYHLTAYSPGIDSGTNLAWMGEADDLDGQGRIWLELVQRDRAVTVYQNRVDMGVDEATVEATVTTASTNVSMSWSVLVGAQLQLQNATNLYDLNWADYGGVITAETAVVNFPAVEEAGSHNFYRLLWLR